MEKEKPDTIASKVAVKNKIHDVISRGISNQLKTKREAKGVRQGSDPQIVGANSSKQALSSHRSTKTAVSNHVMIEKKGVRDKGQGILGKQHVGNSSSSSKTVVQTMGAKDKGVTRPKVSTVKESHSVPVKKPTPAPLKTGVSSFGKSSSLHHNRTADKKDQNVKFKGGGPTASPSNTSSKSVPRIKDTLKSSTVGVTKESKRNTDIRDKASGVSSVKKRTESVVKDGYKKQNSSMITPGSKGYMNDKSGLRTKENQKKLTTEHVRNSKVDRSSQLGTRVEGSSVTVKPRENLGDTEEGSSKKVRERSRTWTISSSPEDNNIGECDSSSKVSDSGVNNCDTKLTSELDLNSLQRRGGDVPSIERTKQKNGTSNDGTVKNSTESRTHSLSIGKFDNDSDFKSNGREQSALVKKNIDEQTDANTGDSAEEYIYEDDFEDYESDFEEYTDDDDEDKEEDTSMVSSSKGEQFNSESAESSDVEDESMAEGGAVKSEGNEAEGTSAMKEDEDDGERKMDSGLYDSGRRKRPEEDFSPLKLARVDADEGFDEREEVVRAEGEKWKEPGREVVKPVSSCTSCEVFFAKREPVGMKAAKMASERGQKLLRMITLDEISYSLFELPPFPYDAFMKCRGHLNTKQISTQTNEDSHSEGVQTDLIPMVDAWTQKPPVIEFSAKEGTESIPRLLDNVSWIRLGRFMESAGEVMAILLEEQWNNSGSLGSEGSSQNSPLSKISIKLGQSGLSESSWESLLVSRPVANLCFCKTRSNLLLCCHGPSRNTSVNTRIQTAGHDGNGMEVDSLSSLLSVWSVSEPSCPYKLLCCQGCVARACFQEGVDDYGQLLFAGCEDGSICVWDMYEKGGCRVGIPFLEKGMEKALCPMFTTHGDETHLGRIVGLEPILDSEFGSGDSEKRISNRVKIANQVCSLDEWGVVVVWSIIRRGMGRVSLVASMRVCLAETNWCTPKTSLPPSLHHQSFRGERISDGVDDVAIWNALAVDCDWILAASDTGSVVCLPVDGEQRSLKVYPGSKESFASAESIAVNPQGLPFFMVGNFLGQVHLYSHSSKRHFGSWEPPSSSLPSAIVKLAWSPQRPFVFFTVDSSSRMHIWDLASSDIFPFATLPSPKVGKITDISLSFPRGNSPAYMAVGMDNGEVVLHHMKEELTSKGHEASRKELSQFIKYANLL